MSLFLSLHPQIFVPLQVFVPLQIFVPSLDFPFASRSSFSPVYLNVYVQLNCCTIELKQEGKKEFEEQLTVISRSTRGACGVTLRRAKER